jgi:hypothetical protein
LSIYCVFPFAVLRLYGNFPKVYFIGGGWHAGIYS